MTKKTLDIAVIGGGVSGVYSAWRLIQNKDSLKVNGKQISCDQKNIAVFEYSNRIGGRLLTVTPPGMPHLPCELGGMRYTTGQKYIRPLVEDVLKLAHRKFPVSEPNNIYYLRGKRLRGSELGNPDNLPYRLNYAERYSVMESGGPGGLLNFAVEQIIPGASKMSPEEWLHFVKTKKVFGEYLYEQGFWNFLQRSLSNEAFQLIIDSSGYYSPTANWNAADAISADIGEFGGSIEYHAVRKGFQEVPLTLAQQFEELGGSIHMSHQLESMDSVQLEDGSKGMRLKFKGQEEYYARSVILAMPRRSLELIQDSGDFFGNNTVKSLIQSVTPAAFFKLFVCYRNPWWQELGLKSGESVTDLPARQTYYWGIEGEQPGADPSNMNSALLASYDDRRNVSFWTGLTNPSRPRFQDLIKHANQNGVSFSEAQWSDYAAPAPMVAEIQRQLMAVHGVKYVPEPYAAAYKVWSGGLFGGGVNFWNIDVKSWEVMEKMQRPVQDLPVHICGSAYSSHQGWVEGALETAEAMLQNQFGLKEPKWVANGNQGSNKKVA